MVQEMTELINEKMDLPPIQQNRPVTKLRTVPHCLGKFRPLVGQCCHQCNPVSLIQYKKLGQNSSLGFLNLLNINETRTRYRGWLVRRVCCMLFVMGCKVYTSHFTNRLERLCLDNRVKEALIRERKAPERGGGQGQMNCLSSFLPLINTCIIPGLLRVMGWVTLKILSSIFDNIQVNHNHLAALHRASQEGSLLLYVHVRQSPVDSALIALVLFCNNLKVPYTVCPLQIKSYYLRAILQKVGVILLPLSALNEQEAEMDSLYTPVMTSLLHELFHEGQAVSVGVSAESGQGGQWLAYITHLIKEGSVTDVTLVPVGISYDCVPLTDIQVRFSSVLQRLWSLLWRKPKGSVRMHFAQPFSLKEMYQVRRWTVNEWLPLQDILLPVVLNGRTYCVFGRRRMSWILSSSRYASAQTDSERDLSVAIILHLIFSATSCMAVMATSLVSSLLLYRHRKGVSASFLCRDVAWLTEEVLFRNKDVGFGGSLVHIVHYSLTVLAPHLIIVAPPSRKDLLIVPHPSPTATLCLTLQARIVTHTFILEAVGACAVSAMLCEVAGSGVSSKVSSSSVDGERVKGDMDFDVVLCQSELTERALQLCHLLPPGFMPPCQSTHSFARDAVDSLVHCGILVMEEITRDTPICDIWKKEGMLTWATSDDPYHSDSDCEEQELRSYKMSQPNCFPEMLSFLCSMLAGHLRALCWTIAGLELLDSSLPEAEFVAHIHSHLCDTANENKQHYESCSEEAAHTAVRTLIDFGVLKEERQEGGGASLGVSPLFQLSENRQKLTCFISQYLYS